ncbi:MAG TPA: hypothetical protein VF426_09525, partial [Marmoricola sp.]
RRLCPGVRISAWAAATYAVMPILTGAVGQGRVGTIGVAIVLPWAASAALSMGDASLERRRRGLWRTILGLGVVVAFAPALGVLVVLAAIALPALGGRAVSRWERVLLAVVPGLMSLAWLPTLVHHPQAGLLEAGRADYRIPHPDVWHLLAGSSGGPGAAPWWLIISLSGVAVLALIRQQTRRPVARMWSIAAAAAVGAAVLTQTRVDLPGLVDPVRPWPGAFLLVMSAALIGAVALAAHGLVGAFSGVSFGWRQPVAAVGLLGALMVPVGGAVWWLVHGTDGPLERTRAQVLPGYLTELGANGRTGATLVIRGGNGAHGDRVTYRVVRGTAARLGDEGLLAVSEPDRDLTRAIAGVFAPNGVRAPATLAARGIAYVYAPAPVSPTVTGAFDAADGFESASAPRPRTRTWQVVSPVSVDALDHRGDVSRPILALLQVIVWVGVVVMAAPSRPQRLEGGGVA